MPNIEAILREINRDLTPEFEKKLRASLADQDREWLIEQIVRLTLDAHSLEERDRRQFQEVETRKRQERVERVRKLALDVNRLEEFVREYRDVDRQRLFEQNLLSEDAPARGSGLITAEHRSVEGTRLLQHAKDMLYGFLFGDESTSTSLQRTQRQLLTLNLPRSKAQTLDFMKATTELSATGTWQDPGSGSAEARTDNIVLEIEYGEMEAKRIGEGVLAALCLINHLEINEKVLYGRMETVEHSTLVSTDV